MESQEPIKPPNSEVTPPLSKVEAQTPPPIKPTSSVEEIILEELDPEEAKKLDPSSLVGSVKFPKGTKVRVINYPRPSDFRNAFDWNGKIGKVLAYHLIGAGIGNRPEYSYQVRFEKAQIPFARLNKETGKLQRGIRIVDAENFFDESYLEYGNE